MKILGAVAQVCTVNDVPFIVFRSASDLGGNSSMLVIKLLEQLWFLLALKDKSVIKVLDQFIINGYYLYI